ncbi:MAG: DNA polymerase I [Spirochaetales bacterium]|nr:DNA polymerase I [Spirochaetales bacterium]
MEALYLLDAYGIIYRSYYAFISRPLRSPSGRNVSAVFGFFRSLFQLWDQFKPGALAAVFDSRVPTFRHAMYDAYKATRQKTPEDLHEQVPLVEEALKLLGVSVLREDGFEADDLIAALAERCRAEGRPCYIVSGDKDLLQLVGGPVKALRPDRDQGFLVLGEAEVHAEWGVPPQRILDYLSLTGDASDNVPGVPGVGDKTALKLLGEFGSFDAIWERLDEVKPDSLKKKLEAGKESAHLSRRLITLAADAPLPQPGVSWLEVAALDRDAASAVFMREGMRSLATRKAADGLLVPPPGAREAAGPRAAQAQPVSQELFPAPALPPEFSRPGSWEAVTDPDRLRDWVKRARKAGTFAFDCETDSLDEMRALPVGFSLAVEPCSACYVPLSSPDAECLSADDARAIVAPLLGDPALCMVGQNLKFDTHVMENWGCAVRCKPWDTMIAAWLIDPERDSLKLEALAQGWLGFAGTSYVDVVPKGSVFSSVALDKAAAYAAEDADLALRLKSVLEPELERRGLSSLMTDLEMPVLGLLSRMEREGILLDRTTLAAQGAELEKDLAAVQTEAWKLVGHEFNLNSPKQLQDVLFVERKLESGKKTKTGYSTDISVLEDLARDDPVPALILRHRGLQKLKSTYVDALLAITGDDPRVRTHYVQTGTATGRLSSRDPNLQNIPVREEEGRRIRKAFVAAPGKVLISADYSQIELVVFAHLSGDEELRKAFIEGADIHRRTAALILGKPEDQVSQSERRAAKTINFGVIYGMGAFRLAQELGISRSDASKFIDAYFARYSGVAAFVRDTVETAKRNGYVSTILGRRRPVRGIDSRNANERQAAERVAVNSPIQGSAADIMKLAMLSVDDALRLRFPDARLLLQVHDELIIEAPASQAGAVSAAVSEAMASAYALSVPLRVGVETADSWGAMH